MKNTIVRQEVIELLKKSGLPCRNLNGTENFRDNLGADSLDVLELVVNAENTFDIKIESTEIPPDFSINFFIEICQEKINDKIMEKYLDSIKIKHI